MHVGGKSEDEWPFLKNEFVNRYRGYKSRSEVPEYPPTLIGIADSANCRAGFNALPPTLIGRPDLVKKVIAGGTNAPLLQVTKAPLNAVMTQLLGAH